MDLNENRKLITFAVPCYNSAAYMDKCINSLLAAGGCAEIIIVDDGSVKDDTAAIADAYQEKYPNIVKAVHQENGGHGEAVNTGLKNASGRFFKVVDSDDWVDEAALKKVIEILLSFETEPDAVLANYVYEHTYDNTRRVISYGHCFPKGRLFTFDETKKLPTGKFISMHSIIYRTELLRECGMVLPKHTFYVDNIFVYYPLPYIKNYYYIDVDLYRYFIGRDDQSVNEKVIMNRIDQHIRVTDLIIESHRLGEVKKQSKKLYKYMLSFVSIMMTINSIYLIKIGTKESYAKKKELWARLKAADKKVYKKCRRRFTGMVGSNSKVVCGFAKFVYVIARKIFKFN